MLLVSPGRPGPRVRVVPAKPRRVYRDNSDPCHWRAPLPPGFRPRAFDQANEIEREPPRTAHPGARDTRVPDSLGEQSRGESRDALLERRRHEESLPFQDLDGRRGGSPLAPRGTRRARPHRPRALIQELHDLLDLIPTPTPSIRHAQGGGGGDSQAVRPTDTSPSEQPPRSHDHRTPRAHGIRNRERLNRFSWPASRETRDAVHEPRPSRRRRDTRVSDARGARVSGGSPASRSPCRGAGRPRPGRASGRDPS